MDRALLTLSGITKAFVGTMALNNVGISLYLGEVLALLGENGAGKSTLITSLSGGNQQKAIVAKWLATEMKVLILDEPTRGIDVGTKQEMYQLIRDLADNGLSIIVVSSEV